MTMRSGSKPWRFLRTAVLTTVAALAGSLLLNAAPASAASNVGSVSFTAATQAAASTTTWTVGFTTATPAGSALTGASGNNQIFVTFNSAFGLPTSPAVTLVTGFSNCTATASASAGVVTVSLAGGSCSLGRNTAAQLSLASITNPAAGSYPASSFSVRTSNDSAASPAANIIIFGTASKLAFTTQPAGATAGSAFTTQPVVTVQDANGNTVANSSSSVTLAITGGTGSPAANLTCTANPKAASAGVVSFAGCRIDKAGTGYTLTATAGPLNSAVTNSFAVSAGAPTKVAFSVAPPTTGTAGTPLATFRAAVQDANGNTVTTGTGSSDAITLGIATGPGGSFNSAATTYTDVAAAAGVATFTGIVLNTAGSYTFTATDTTRTLATATSTSATAIGAAAASKLSFIQNPGESQAGAALTPTVTVQVQDQFGNPVSAGGIAVNLASSAGPLNAGGSATTNGSGLASFGSARINTAATGLTLTATASGLSSAISAAFDVVVQVSNTNAALTDAAADSGATASGVRSVSYYYCAGYTGSCTSGNWTLIGTATGAGSGYLLTWTGQPANGQYRLVAVATDNVTNVSSPSATIPVRVAN